MIFLGIGMSSQILVNQGFESSVYPPQGWSMGNFLRTTTDYCNGTAAIKGLADDSPASTIYSTNESHGGDIHISFNYSAIATSPGNTISGSLVVEYAVFPIHPYNPVIIFSGRDITSSTTCSTFTGLIPAGRVPVGSHLQIRIRGFKKGGLNNPAFNLVLDDIKFTETISCNVPLDLTSPKTAANSIDILWKAPAVTPSNYDIYYSTLNTSPSSTTIPNETGVSGISAVLDGLNTNTDYYIWVRSSCGMSEKSFWTGPLKVKTGYCIPNRDAQTTSYLKKIITSTANFANLNYTASSSSTYVDNSAVSFSGSPGGNINYFLQPSGATYTNDYHIWIDWNNDQDFNDAGELVFTTNVSASSFSGSFTIPAGQALGNYRVRFGTSGYGGITECGPVSSGNYTGGYVDFNLNVMSPPTCFAPTNLNVASVSLNSTTVSWNAPTANVPSNGYDIYYSTSNTAPIASTIPGMTGVSGTSATIQGLTTNANYYVWVRSRCTPSDQSAWVGSVTMLLGYCNPAGSNSNSSPYYFFKKITTTTPNFTSLDYTASTYTAYVDNSSLVFSGTPGENISFSLIAALSKYIWVDWNNDLDFNDAGENVFNSNASTGSFTIPDNQALGNYRVRFGTSNSSLDYPLAVCGPTYNSINFVDFTLNVTAPPTCLAPTTVVISNKTKNSAAISWVVSTTPPQYGYDIYYSTSNTIPTASTAPLISGVLNNIETLNGLNANTQYYVWIRSHCSIDDIGVWSNPVSFVTVSENLATSETELRDSVQIHPNPFIDILNIPNNSKVQSVLIINPEGRVVKTIEKPSSSLQLGDLKSGIYLVTLNMKDGSKQTIKAIKK